MAISDPSTIAIKVLKADTAVLTHVKAADIFYAMRPDEKRDIQVTVAFDEGASEHSLEAASGLLEVVVSVADKQRGETSPFKKTKEIAKAVSDALDLKDRLLDQDGVAMYHIRKLDGQPNYDNELRTWQLVLTFEVTYGAC
jgi:hypothetical protein